MNATQEDKNFVAVYPEIYHGNEAGANTVVRYILNKPGTMASYGVQGPLQFGANDHLYYFSRLFGKAVDDNHYMFLPIIDTHIFKDHGKVRNKRCVFVGKGQDKKLHPEGCIVIDRNRARDQQGLADLLNECSVMYGYDPVSAMYEIARLCGCRVVLMQDEYTRDEWSLYEPGMNGISWGKDEEKPLDSQGFKDHYEWLRSQFSIKLNKFIEVTQK